MILEITIQSELLTRELIRINIQT